LATGTSTGTVTVADPNALDSPQSITVIVEVGGDVPGSLTFYVAPGGTTSSSFTTGSAVKTTVSASTPWLTVSSATSQGITTVTVQATASSSMAASAYNGTVTISGSKFAPDNQQVSVTLNVTAEPIVQASSSTVSFTIAQGANAQTTAIAVTDAGQGTLTISGVTAAAANSGTWLTVAFAPGPSDSTVITITADPTGLTPNTYAGTVTIASNAVNPSVVIPVELTVVAQGPPLASAGGVVNNGTFGANEPLAQGDIVAVFGSQFTYGDAQGATSLPLQTIMNGVQVLVNGTAAPIYYVSPGQINFEIPIDASTANGGGGTVQVVRNGQPGNLVYVDINAQAPRFIVYDGGYGIMTTPQGALTGIPSSPVKVGDTIVIYALGLGPTSPPVASGTASPSSPLAKVPGTTQVCFGVESPFHQSPCATALFSGLTPGFVGLYQINVTIPAGIPSGNSTISLLLVNNVESTPVQLAVQ
jgi:adhesin/invasin